MKNKILFVYALILTSFFLFATETKAQTNSKSNFLSNVYFPFDFGLAISNSKALEIGSMNKTGVEFRVQDQRGVFFRYNYVSQKHAFRFPDTSIAKVVEGDLSFNDHLLGSGMRIGEKKLKGIALLEGGISTFSMPQVTITSNGNYQTFELKQHSPLVRLTTGIEYYIASNAAIVFELGYISRFSKNTSFSKESLQTLSISIGLTTTLF